MRLVNAIKLYWTNRGLLPLGLAVILEALHRPGAQEPTSERAQGLFNAGQLRYFMGRYGEARRCLEASLEIARRLGDVYVAAVLQPLGLAAIGEGDFMVARRCFDQATQLYQARGDRRGLAGALNGLGMLYRIQGESSRARPLYEEVVRLADEHGNDEAKATGLLDLSMLCIDMGFVEQARSFLEEAMQIAARLPSVPAAASSLDVCAGLACLEGDWQTAVRFVAASDAQCSRSGVRREPADAMFLNRKMVRCRALISSASYEATRAEGAAIPLLAALGEAHSWLDRGADASGEAPSGGRSPSPDRRDIPGAAPRPGRTVNVNERGEPRA